MPDLVPTHACHFLNVAGTDQRGQEPIAIADVDRARTLDVVTEWPEVSVSVTDRNTNVVAQYRERLLNLSSSPGQGAQHTQAILAGAVSASSALAAGAHLREPERTPAASAPL